MDYIGGWQNDAPGKDVDILKRIPFLRCLLRVDRRYDRADFRGGFRNIQREKLNENKGLGGISVVLPGYFFTLDGGIFFIENNIRQYRQVYV